MSKIVRDPDARKLKVSMTYAHTILWHLIDGMGGAVSMPEPDSTLPSHRYVCFFQNEDGSVEIISNDEEVKRV